jgi:hypothetical protein
MTELDENIRTVLQDRVLAGPDNPARTTQIHARLGRIRRRRAATALGVALTLGGGLFAVALLPAQDRSSSLAVPRPPYFDGVRPIDPAGYQYIGGIDFTQPRGILVVGHGHRPALLAAHCQRAGVLQVRASSGSSDVPCNIRVGGGYEGAVLLRTDDAAGFLAMSPTGLDNLQLQANSSGNWEFAVFEAILPDRLQPYSPNTRPLLDGTEHPGGGVFTLDVTAVLGSRRGDWSFLVECVEGIRLVFRTAGQELATATCSPENAKNTGDVLALVSARRSADLGLRSGQRIEVTVERSGRASDQWRVDAALGSP